MPDITLGAHVYPWALITAISTSSLHQSALAKSRCNNKTTTNNHGLEHKDFILTHVAYPSSVLCHPPHFRIQANKVTKSNVSWT